MEKVDYYKMFSLFVKMGETTYYQTVLNSIKSRKGLL